MGPIMFINDIVDNISSPIRLFADDCLLYRVIQFETDTVDLQSDLDTLAHWSHMWQMELNISKCIVINCTRAHTVISNTYVLQGQTLQCKLDHPYLGLTPSNTMQWSHHITNISNKASKVINFLRRNLYRCSNEVKAAAFLAIVRPLMEYTSVVWDPHLNVYINMLRRAARWVTGCYGRYSSVTTMLASLKWPTLAQRRKIARLKLFYKIMYNSSALILPPYYQYTQRNTRRHHHLDLIQRQTNTTAY